MLLVGGGGPVTQERAGLRIAPRRLPRSSSHLFELGARVDGQAVILALGNHQPSCQRVTELGGQCEPPLVVELRRVGAEKHPANLPPPCLTTEPRSLRCPPLYPTIPHIAPFDSKSGQCAPPTPPDPGDFSGPPVAGDGRNQIKPR